MPEVDAVGENDNRLLMPIQQVYCSHWQSPSFFQLLQQSASFLVCCALELNAAIVYRGLGRYVEIKARYRASLGRNLSCGADGIIREEEKDVGFP
jgi:hypothetical protein